MKNITILYPHLLCFIVIVTAFLSCKKEDPSPIAGCCDLPAINQAVGIGHIYVPNIFTPNNDGINDQFIVFTDSIQWILVFQIKNDKDDTVFDTTGIAPQNFNFLWNGKVNGSVTKGLYSIFMYVVADDGATKVLQGTVCNYPCDAMPEDPIEAINCQFPAQNDDGYFNNNLPSGESNDCFTN